VTDQPLPNHDLQRLRDGEAMPDPCSGCGAAARLESDGLPHTYHEPGCPVAQRITELIRDKDDQC
jgi:hypothetical protein